MSVIYTFYLDNGGEAVADATPTFDAFINLTDSATDIEGGGSKVEILSGSEPDIYPLGDGFYFFKFDWDTQDGGASSYLVKIRCGEADEFINPDQRFIIMRLDRNDNLSNMVNTIETSSNNITTATNILLKSVNRLLEVEQGTWEIKEENAEYYLNLYPTNDGSGNSLYESGLNSDVPFARYKLQDENNLSTATNPFKRLQVVNSIADLP